MATCPVKFPILEGVKMGLGEVYFLVHPPANSEKMIGRSTTASANKPLKRRVTLERVREEDEVGVDGCCLVIFLLTSGCLVLVGMHMMNDE